jgi:hypothetical protein
MAHLPLLSVHTLLYVTAAQKYLKAVDNLARA